MLGETTYIAVEHKRSKKIFYWLRNVRKLPEPRFFRSKDFCKALRSLLINRKFEAKSTIIILYNTETVKSKDLRKWLNVFAGTQKN